ncbi:hypothetical protein [Streptomyces sp. LN704]|uniref:hypothetical protein n=1 Tax=Streptomyces sp. LN704 TaxID=3112982 RepID=UPI00371EEE3B
MTTVVADCGRHVSVHLAEQDGQVLLLAFSDHPQPPEMADDVLPRLRASAAVSCGTETAAGGRPV